MTEATSEPRPSAASPPSAFDVARRVLLRVEAGAYASLALSGELERARLDDSARGLCTELVYGSLRKQARIDQILAGLTPRGLSGLDTQARVLLRLGAYQLLHTRVSPVRAVNQVVTTLRTLRGPGLAGFANALLRRLAREGAPTLPALPPDASPAAVAAALAQQHGLPPFLLADLLPMLGRDGATALCAALDTPAPTWLRLNPLRGSYAEALDALRREGAVLADGEAGDASAGEALLRDSLPEAVRLLSGHPFAGPAYRRGLFTAQDLGAQLVTRLLLADSEEGALRLPDGPLLDACCGTGGKATHLAALLSAAGLGGRRIDAADQSARKLELCHEHLARLGCRDVHPRRVDLMQPEAIASQLSSSYAAILLDAPCSGSGVLRRHPEARTRLSREGVIALAETQRRILEALLPRLAPGGVLVYAVCSPLPSEGTELLSTILTAHPKLRPLPPSSTPLWSSLRRGPLSGIHTWPQEHNADAFFALRLMRVPSSQTS